MNYKHLGPRLYISFSLLSVLVLLSSSLLTYKLNSIKSNTDVMIKQDFVMYQASEKITLGIVQVQQWLTDISATRALDGLDDGFDQAHEFAEMVRSNIGHMKNIDPENKEEYQRLLTRFEDYYSVGQTMAQSYIDNGPEEGNKQMAKFDQVSESLQNELAPIKQQINDRLHNKLLLESETIQQINLQTVAASSIIFIMLLVAGWMIHAMLLRMKAIGHSMNTIADGHSDLNAHIASEHDDEVSDIAAGFNRFVKKLNKMVSQVISISNQLSSASQNTQMLTVQTSESITAQAEEVKNLAETIGRMSALTQNVKTSIDSTTQQVQTVAEEAETGGEVIESAISQIQNLVGEVESVNGTVTELNQKSESISSVVTMIAKIAEQTNLLALNAAIEAARAGEHGRGFAVVADEVRNLSASTTKATQDIQALIELLQNSSSNAVQQVTVSSQVAIQTLNKSRAAGDAFNAITQSVSEIRELISGVVDLAAQEGQLSDQVNANIVQINREVQAISTAAKQNISVNGDLSQYSVLLQAVISDLTEKTDLPVHDDVLF